MTGMCCFRGLRTASSCKQSYVEHFGDRWNDAKLRNEPIEKNNQAYDADRYAMMHIDRRKRMPRMGSFQRRRRPPMGVASMWIPLR